MGGTYNNLFLLTATVLKPGDGKPGDETSPHVSLSGIDLRYPSGLEFVNQFLESLFWFGHMVPGFFVLGISSLLSFT